MLQWKNTQQLIAVYNNQNDSIADINQTGHEFNSYFIQIDDELYKRIINVLKNNFFIYLEKITEFVTLFSRISSKNKKL